MSNQILKEARRLLDEISKEDPGLVERALHRLGPGGLSGQIPIGQEEDQDLCLTADTAYTTVS